MAALGVAAAVAVVLALPSGVDNAADQAAATSSTTPTASPTTTSSPTDTSRTAVRVPAAQATGAATGMTQPAAETADGPGSSSPPPAVSPSTSAGATPIDGTVLAAPAKSPLPPTVAPPAPPAPAAPPQPAAPAPAATSAPPSLTKTTPPKTTAPKTTAPKTTAPKTTVPKTTAPKTTAPKTTAPTAPNFTIPVTVGNASQLITVTASSPSATSGTLRAWQKSANGSWRVVYGPVKAWVGSSGIGKASESSSRTPLGTFTLTEAFGRLDDPGTALPYHKTGPNDWWVSDMRAASYNTMQTCAKTSCPFNTQVSEHLQSITPYYNYAVVMDVNRSPVVPGAGSAFFLHVSVGKPTAGCVAIDSSTLVSIMRWLDPAQHPRIATGIG